MVVIQTLEDIALKTLCETFNKAFSDYQINTVMSESQMETNLHKNGYSPACSIGLFDEGRLVGFILNARRNNASYDCGTGIIPEYRKKGYAHDLIQATKETLVDLGLDTWILEVLSDNLRAKTLYEKAGFTTKRHLHCYSTPVEKLRANTKVELRAQHHFSIPQGECLPSWQNSTDSMATGVFPLWDIFYGNTRCGVLCFNPINGSIAQIYIEPNFRNRGIAKEAIIEAANQCISPNIQITNVDASYAPLNNLFHRLGFSLFTTQEEMVCPLGEKT